MAGRDYPVRFTPRGLSDAYDATDTFPGACRSLQNLVFDQSNPEIVVARPGVGNPLVSMAAQNSLWGGVVAWGTSGYIWGSVTFTTPTVITVHIAIGNTIYGMVSSALNPGKDQPFAFVIGTGFVAISGVTSANVPVSPATTGDWTPPTMAVIGTKIIVTHTGFSGANYFGAIDITTPSAPTWSAGNTTTYMLPSVPTFVANFNNRAYFICGNVVYYSDVLAPTVMTNAGQALTVGDTTSITALSGLPVSTTSAGVVAALIVFKPFQIWQITGDAAVTGSLALNFLSLNVGCVSPRSIVQTPIGSLFIGINGPYMVSPLGGIGPLTKDQSKLTQDVQQPFQSIVNPSRAAASFSGALYRICLDTVINGVTTTADYWLDITRRRWTGPHSFAYDCASQVGNYFVISSRYYGASLFASSYIPNANSTYNDNGLPITVTLESSSFPKTQNINEKQVIESTLELSSVASSLTYTVNAIDESRSVLGSAQINVVNQSGLWGWDVMGWWSNVHVCL